MEGFWTIEFATTTGGFGAGVLVFRDSQLVGGDNGYFYIGTYEFVGGNAFRATVEVTPFVSGIESVFNTLGKNLKLELEGSLLPDGAHAIAQGYLAGMPTGPRLGVKLTKRS